MTKTIIFLAVIFCMSLAAGADAEDATAYELRTYTTNEGKLDQLHTRFREHTLKIFEKHGMKSIGYWIPANTPNTLIYLLQHKSNAAAAESWKAFIGDPEWQKVYAASITDGQLVSNIESTFMSATDYSPMR